MFELGEALIILVLWIIPLLIGLLAGVFRELPDSTTGSEQPSTSWVVYQRGIRLAKLPAMGLFLLLVVSGLIFSLMVGYGGGPPPMTVLVLERIGLVLVIGVSVAGFTTAGAVTGVLLRHRVK